jgi:hypothetical protein
MYLQNYYLVDIHLICFGGISGFRSKYCLTTFISVRKNLVNLYNIYIIFYLNLFRFFVSKKIYSVEDIYLGGTQQQIIIENFYVHKKM